MSMTKKLTAIIALIVGIGLAGYAEDNIHYADYKHSDGSFTRVTYATEGNRTTVSSQAYTADQAKWSELAGWIFEALFL